MESEDKNKNKEIGNIISVIRAKPEDKVYTIVGALKILICDNCKIKVSQEFKYCPHCGIKFLG